MPKIGGCSNLITESQLIGWKNLETAKICWAISDLSDIEKYDFYEMILAGKSIKKFVNILAKKNEIDISKIDYNEVLEVHLNASKTYQHWKGWLKHD